MERRRARSFDVSSIPVPETPVESSMNGPNDDSGLELIGQELVIHRTLHQPTGQPPPAALVTPTRPRARSVSSALAEDPNPGVSEGNGGAASVMQMMMTYYPRRTLLDLVVVLVVNHNSFHCLPKTNFEEYMICRTKLLCFMKRGCLGLRFCNWKKLD